MWNCKTNKLYTSGTTQVPPTAVANQPMHELNSPILPLRTERVVVKILKTPRNERVQGARNRRRLTSQSSKVMKTHWHTCDGILEVRFFCFCLFLTLRVRNVLFGSPLCCWAIALRSWCKLQTAVRISYFMLVRTHRWRLSQHPYALSFRCEGRKTQRQRAAPQDHEMSGHIHTRLQSTRRQSGVNLWRGD